VVIKPFMRIQNLFSCACRGSLIISLDTWKLTAVGLKTEVIMDSYTMESVVQGYHIYKEIWSASIGMSLGCERETFNPSDPYAVAMTHNSNS